MTGKIFFLSCLILVFIACESADESAVTPQSRVNNLTVNTSSTNLESASISVTEEGFTAYKYDLYFTTARVSIEEGNPILQDSLFRLIEFSLYSDNPGMENGDYVIQMNEGILNTVNIANYYSAYKVDTDEENEAVIIDSGVL